MSDSPVRILLTADNTATPAINQASASLETLAARADTVSKALTSAQDRLDAFARSVAGIDTAAKTASTSLTGLETSFTRLGTATGTALDRLTAFGTSLDAFSQGVVKAQVGSDAATASFDKLSTSSGRAGDMFKGVADSVNLYVKAVGELDKSDAAGSTSMDKLVTGARSLTVTLSDTTRIVDLYTASLAKMDAAQTAAAASMARMNLTQSTGANGIGGAADRTIANDLSGGPSFRVPGGNISPNGRVSGGVGGFGASFAGVGAAALAGGLVAAGAGYIGFKSVQDASQYWSALSQSAAQSGTLQNSSQLQSFGQGILQYAGGGKSPYSATTLAQGVEMPLAAGYSTQALLQALPNIAQLAKQNNAPDLTNADKLITTLAAAMGTGAKSTGAQLQSYADFASRAEQLTTAAPGLITTSLPTVLGSLPGTGVDANDATALLLKAGQANPGRLQQMATSERQFIQSTQVKPTAGAQAMASKLGLAIGSGSADAYGGIIPYIQAIENATGGNANEISQLLPQKNAMQFFNSVMMGGGTGAAAGFASSLSNATGTNNNAFTQLSQGTSQQWDQTMTRLNADMITMGTTLNQTVVPALIKGADAMLKGMVPARSPPLAEHMTVPSITLTVSRGMCSAVLVPQLAGSGTSRTRLGRCFGPCGTGPCTGRPRPHPNPHRGCRARSDSSRTLRQY